MPIERYFLEEPIQSNEIKLLTGAEFHHLARVTRVRPGELIELVNGKGILAQATVTAVEKERAVVHIDQIQEEKSTHPAIILAQAMPKLNRLDFILEKGTELGVDEFWLFPGDLSLKKDFSENQTERAHSLTVSAMKQCGRLTLPKVKVMPKLEKWAEINGSAFFGDTASSAPLFFRCFDPDVLVYPLIFFVGPESGWSKAELDCLRMKGVRGVKLHDNILRTDTASLAAVSLMRHWLMTSQIK